MLTISTNFTLEWFKIVCWVTNKNCKFFMPARLTLNFLNKTQWFGPGLLPTGWTRLGPPPGQAPGYLACQHNCHELTFRFCLETKQPATGKCCPKALFLFGASRSILHAKNNLARTKVWSHFRAKNVVSLVVLVCLLFGFVFLLFRCVDLCCTIKCQRSCWGLLI